jgi:hypothetical protein
MIRAYIAGGLVIATVLAGCSGQRLSIGDSATPDQSTAEMPGRWILAAPNAPTCGMNFAGAPGTQNGNVVPEGGCPGNFFMSRRWVLEQGELVIIDQDNNPLARLKFANGLYEGQSTAGTPITLSR